MSFEDQYIDCFNNFIKKLQIIFIDKDINETLIKIYNFNNEKKIYNGLLFVSLFNDEYFDLLVNNKIKLFSHKNSITQEISESLFNPVLSLKNLLNNQPDDIKKIIWFYLHSIYSTIERTKNNEIQNINRLNIIDKLINNNNSTVETTKNKLKEMLDVNVNNETSDMIDDIIKSFESIISNPKGSNPLSGIMDISQKISVKYNDKISNGDIELDKLMESISKKIPGMDKIMTEMTDGSSGMKDMMNGLMGGNKKEQKEKIMIDENFSTSNIQIGEIEETNSNNIKIGNILKIADKFGIIPGNKKSDDKPDLDTSNIEGIPNIGKMMGIMQKLNKTSTPDEADNLKQEMNSFLQNDLGIDMNSFNEQLEEMTKKISEPNDNDNLD